MRVYTAKGTPLDLRDPCLGKGGEGSVFLIEGYEDRVAKIYEHAEPHRLKVEAMASIGDEVAAIGALSNVAWPLAALYADARQETFVGFGMCRIEGGLSLGEAYEFPPSDKSDMSLRQRISYLINLASLVDGLHSIGQIVGDFNSNNIRLLESGAVGLIDADSFHVCIDGVVWRCEVCLSGYMAPELIRNTRGTTFAACRKETFTVHTDDFSLAVHVFRMLFNGVHPFHCLASFSGQNSIPAPLPLEKRVERGETPFFAKVENVDVPSFAPPVSSVPPFMREMFVRAFVEGVSHPEARPSAYEWSCALMRFGHEIKPCTSGVHWYWNALEECPYCYIEKCIGLVRDDPSFEESLEPIEVALQDGDGREASDAYEQKAQKTGLMLAIVVVAFVVFACLLLFQVLAAPF